MVKLWAHIFWGLIVPVVGVTLVVFGSRFGMLFWPKWFGVDPVMMMFAGIVLISTFLLGSIFKYCDVVNRMEF